MIKLPKRASGGVGKEIGGNTYVHRKYCLNQWAPIFIPAVTKQANVRHFSRFNIVKFGRDGKIVSVIDSPDFDTADEPIVKSVLLVKTGKIINYNPPYWIYHHKWMMVGDDYEGFDVQASKNRSLAWMSKCMDFSRIGRQDVWQEFLKRHGI